MKLQNWANDSSFAWRKVFLDIKQTQMSWPIKLAILLLQHDLKAFCPKYFFDIKGLNCYSTTISHTFKSATFEIATNFFFA